MLQLLCKYNQHYVTGIVSRSTLNNPGLTGIQDIPDMKVPDDPSSGGETRLHRVRSCLQSSYRTQLIVNGCANVAPWLTVPINHSVCGGWVCFIIISGYHYTHILKCMHSSNELRERGGTIKVVNQLWVSGGKEIWRPSRWSSSVSRTAGKGRQRGLRSQKDIQIATWWWAAVSVINSSLLIS